MRWLTMVVFVFAAQAWGSDEFIDGQKLLETCKAPPASFRESMCFFYLMGVNENWHGKKGLDDVDGANFCAPVNVTGAELREAALTFLETRPTKLHLPASELVIQAFKHAFPCG